MKRICSVILYVVCFVMLLYAAPALPGTGALAESDGRETCGDYIINSGNDDITIYSYTGTDENVVVPAEMNSRPVKCIETRCFDENDSIRTLTISEGVEILEPYFASFCNNLTSLVLPSTIRYNSRNVNGRWWDGAFIERCSALETITVADGNPYLRAVDNVLYNAEMTILYSYPTQKKDTVFRIPEGIQMLEPDAFEDNTYIREAVLPDSVKTIGYWGFNWCSSLEKINIPDQCQRIGQYAFQQTKLTEMHIPASVVTIVAPAFPYTLKHLTVDSGNTVFYAEDDVLFSYDGGLHYYAPLKTDSVYTVPSCIDSIAMRAFSHAENLKEIVLHNGITIINGEAFSDCYGLETMTIPSSVQLLNCSFYNCYNLAKLYIPASVKVFEGSLLANVSGTVIFGEPGSAAQTWAEENGFAFHDMHAEWEGASGTSTDHIEWKLSADGVLRLDGTGILEDGPWNQYSNSVKTLILSEGFTGIGMNAAEKFRNVTRVLLPDSLESIGYIAFNGLTRLTGLFIPDHVAWLSENAFRNCSNLIIGCNPGSAAEAYAQQYDIPYVLITFTLPESVSVIKPQAFADTAARGVYLPSTIEEIAGDAFDSSAIIFAQAGSYAEQWALANGFICMTMNQ